jgi:hypothetical protein
MMKPRMTLRRSLIVIACIGLGLGMLRALLKYDGFFGFGTVYATSYDEGRFKSIRIGMTRTQVETIMGTPLKKLSGRWQAGDEIWAYSDQPNPMANYWRRWLIFQDGKVAQIENAFYVD